MCFLCMSSEQQNCIHSTRGFSHACFAVALPPCHAALLHTRQLRCSPRQMEHNIHSLTCAVIVQRTRQQLAACVTRSLRWAMRRIAPALAVDASKDDVREEEPVRAGVWHCMSMFLVS